MLTGAGLSAESGVSTFRDPDGIWSKYDWRDVATPEGFQRDPGRVHEFYNARRRAHAGVSPNAAHLAMARLEAGMELAWSSESNERKNGNGFGAAAMPCGATLSILIKPRP